MKHSTPKHVLILSHIITNPITLHQDIQEHKANPEIALFHKTAKAAINNLNLPIYPLSRIIYATENHSLLHQIIHNTYPSQPLDIIAIITPSIITTDYLINTLHIQPKLPRHILNSPPQHTFPHLITTISQTQKQLLATLHTLSGSIPPNLINHKKINSLKPYPPIHSYTTLNTIEQDLKHILNPKINTNPQKLLPLIHPLNTKLLHPFHSITPLTTNTNTTIPINKHKRIHKLKL